jgi:hypothetical protein
MNNERMPNQIVTSRMEGKGKRRRQWKRLIDVVEEVLKILGVRNWSVARDWKEWRRSVLGAKVHNRLDARGGRGGGGEVYHISFCSMVESSQGFWACISIDIKKK